MKNAVFGETMKSVRKHRDIKLVTTNEKRDYLVSERNCHKWFSENLLTLDVKKIKVMMDMPVYLGVSI